MIDIGDFVESFKVDWDSESSGRVKNLAYYAKTSAGRAGASGGCFGVIGKVLHPTGTLGIPIDFKALHKVAYVYHHPIRKPESAVVYRDTYLLQSRPKRRRRPPSMHT